jgi:hypothetical protein
MIDWTTITLMFERREDGGLRLWSPEFPGLVLSNPDPLLVIADISPALKVFYEETATAIIRDAT